MKLVLTAFLGLCILGSGTSRAQDGVGPTEGAATDQPESVTPPTPAPEVQPPAPPVRLPPPPVAQQQQATAPVVQYGAPEGQWVYTGQYGWVWMPYGQQYVYQGAAGDASPYAYVYYPAIGWSWLVAPWVWGWGAYPHFGLVGPWHYPWYRGLYHAGYGWGGYRHHGHGPGPAGGYHVGPRAGYGGGGFHPGGRGHASPDHRGFGAPGHFGGGNRGGGFGGGNRGGGSGNGRGGSGHGGGGRR